MDIAALKAEVIDDVERRAATLIDASHQIHARPELAYEEHFAHDLLCSILEAEHIDTQRNAFGLDTAFQASAGTSGPTVAVLCEYDALPEIGHACGHNIIATAGLGAGLAAAALAERLGCRVRILGTPAEEGGGGKIVMAERGAFDGVDAALMVHPAGLDLMGMNCVAIQQLDVAYHGLAAHAAAAPHKGRNALDAAVLGYVNVAALRQHIQPGERIHGIFTHGGDKPNIVPQFASQFWYVRARTLAALEPLKERVLTCLQAGALAAGCTCEPHWHPHPYSDMIDSRPIVQAFTANAAALGRSMADPAEIDGVVGSTDMGNISYLVPSIHPMIAVAPAGVSIHTPEFAMHAAAPEGDRGVIDGAKALAMTVVDLWASGALRDEASSEHRRSLAQREVLGPG